MMKPYESYKEISFYNIPTSWNIQRLGSIFVENKNLNTEVSETNALQFKFGEIIQKKKFEIDEGLKQTLSKYTLVKKDDIMINGLNLNYDFLTQRVAMVKEKGVITSAYIALSPNKSINASYYNFLFKTLDTQKVFNGMGSGIRLTLDYKELKKMLIPIPPRSEQDQIVRYLDWQLSKINKLIKAKKKQIELLNEQKQAIINKAVTKGLDDTAPMKDSGVDWLGEVPEGWEQFQLGKCTQIILSGLDKKSYEGQKNVLLCNYVDVYKNDYVTDTLNFMNATASESEICNLKVKADDVIITKDSESWDDIGVPAYVPDDIENLYCAYHLAILRTDKSIILGEFLYNAFRSQYVQVQHKVKAKGVTRFALGYQPIHDTFLFVPSLEEQIAIIKKINIDCRIQNQYIVNIKKELDLLTEYKISLISSVVTGKVDVRDVIVPEYETCDDQQDIDEPDETEDIEELEVE